VGENPHAYGQDCWLLIHWRFISAVRQEGDCVVARRNMEERLLCDDLEHQCSAVLKGSINFPIPVVLA
jgi:hypothetical protein